MRRSKSFSCSQPGVGVITGRYIQPPPIRNATAAGNVAILYTSRGRKTALQAISVGHVACSQRTAHRHCLAGSRQKTPYLPSQKGTTDDQPIDPRARDRPYVQRTRLGPAGTRGRHVRHGVVDPPRALQLERVMPGDCPPSSSFIVRNAPASTVGGGTTTWCL